jgi:hypothetical protein
MGSPRSLRLAAPLSLILLALVLRLWYVTTLPGQGGEDLLFSDMAAYDQTGWSMVQGQPAQGEPGLNGYHPFTASTYYFVGYTHFLAAIDALFGHAHMAVRVIQAVIGAATIGDDRLVWCLIGVPMGILAMLFVPRRHRRWVPIFLALVPYVVIPFIASAFPRYRIPAVPLVFVLAGQSLVACWDCRSWRPGCGRKPGCSLVSGDAP